MDKMQILLYVAKECARLGVDDLGKKKYQKLIYLAEKIENVQLGYQYEIYLYGPFSRGLDDDLIDLSYDGLIEYKRDGRSRLMRLTPGGEARLESSVDFAPQSTKDAIDDTLKKFARRAPYDLEILTTTHYVASALGNPENRELILRGVKKVKGEKFSDETINSAISELASV